MDCQPHQQRVVQEKSELDEKANALSKFIGENPIFDGLPPEEQERLKVQNDLMWQYSEILGLRISAFRQLEVYAKVRDLLERRAVAEQNIEQIASERYKVAPSHDSMFHRWAVVAGDGAQQIYLGREAECKNMARKFAGAFLDGAYLARQTLEPELAPDGILSDLKVASREIEKINIHINDLGKGGKGKTTDAKQN